MYTAETYRNNPTCSILFEEDGLFVVKDDAPEPLGTTWLVSDGDNMFTTSDEPELNPEYLYNLIAEYKQLKEDSENDPIGDISDQDLLDEDILNNL